MHRPLDGRTILVADDKPELVDMISDALRAAGATVLEARDGEEALVLLRSHHVDALVSDLKMPRMNGHELLRALRAMSATKRGLPAIAVSGEDSWKYLDPFAAALAGFDYHFIKPIAPEVLIEHLARLLPPDGRGRRRSQRKLPRVA